MCVCHVIRDMESCHCEILVTLCLSAVWNARSSEEEAENLGASQLAPRPQAFLRWHWLPLVSLCPEQAKDSWQQPFLSSGPFLWVQWLTVPVCPRERRYLGWETYLLKTREQLVAWCKIVTLIRVLSLFCDGRSAPWGWFCGHFM